MNDKNWTCDERCERRTWLAFVIAMIVFMSGVVIVVIDTLF